MKYLDNNNLRLLRVRFKKSETANLSQKWFHVSLVEWIIDCLLNLTELYLGTNKRPFLAYLVLYE